MGASAAEADVIELTQEEGRELVDSEARRLLGMSLEEFEAAYDAGKLDIEEPGVLTVWMLLPFAR